MKIKNILKFKKYQILFLLFLGIFLLSVHPVLAQDYIKYQPNISIPGSQFLSSGAIEIRPDSLALYIKAIYRYAGVIAGAFAMFMLVYGAWQWLMAAGNASKIAMAKETVSTTLIGLAFLFGGYLLLAQISVNLVTFKPLTKIMEKRDVKDLSACGVGVTCSGGYSCAHEIYFAGEDYESHCPANQVEYLVAACSDNGDSYNNVSAVQANCTCRENRTLDQDIQCRPLFLQNLEDYCKSIYVGMNKDNDGCASYATADSCRSNICYGKETLSGDTFSAICGISLNSIEVHNPYEVQDCKKITDVRCTSNIDCRTGSGVISDDYCCANRNNLGDYCRPRNEEGIVCKTN
jgi:hypothetical protein